MYKKGKVYKKVDLSNLPGSNKYIDWRHSAGCEIPFIYNDIKGVLYVVEWISSKKIAILYNGDEIVASPRSIIEGKLGKILNIYNYTWKYEIGQEINGKTGFHGKILRRYYKETPMSTKGRYYDILCYKCNQVITKFENVIEETGCNICRNGELRVGFNDLWTTHPDIAKQLHNPEDGYTTTYGARKNFDWNCPYCGRLVKNMLPMDVINATDNTVPCECRKDSYSYPNKFIFNLLTVLEEDFEFEKNFKEWKELGRRRYDFYIKNKSIIIEADGSQHFDKRFPEIRKNDEEKEKIAKQNGIKHYIHIDCRKSNTKYISNNIIKSELVNFYDLSKIDWFTIGYKANQNTCDLVIKILKDNNYSVTRTAEIIKIDRVIISKYLNEAIRAGILDKDEVRRIQLSNKILQHYQLDAKPVFCIEEGIAFGNYSQVKNFLEPEITKNFSSGSLVQGIVREGTAYGYHWKRITKEEFNKFKVNNPTKAFGDYFLLESK